MKVPISGYFVDNCIEAKVDRPDARLYPSIHLNSVNHMIERFYMNAL